MKSVHASGAPRPQSPLRAHALWIWILVVILPGLSAVLYAQQAAPRPVLVSGASLDAAEVSLLVGRSMVLNLPTPITRVSLTSPEVADALVTTPQQLLIHGKTSGTISMFVWERAGSIRRYEVVVRRDLSQLEAQIGQLFPGEPIAVSSNGTDVVLSGTVSSKYVVEKAAEVAVGYVEKKENVVNLLVQQQTVGSNQVLLRVRFAEVSRSALQELGASFFSNGVSSDWIGRSAPPGVPGPDFDSEKGLVFSDFLNLFVFNTKEGIGGVVRALATRGLFQSLAEPNLVAISGAEASFLAGGEYPYPVAQSSGGGTNVTIQFKEFGIRLNFTPTVLGGDLIHLKVKPEVSALDFSNAVTLEGFRVPALTTRRTETQVELRDGQTFAIAGLLNNTVTSSMSKIPGIGDIPILGLLFRSKAHQKNQSELVVMITPQIIRGNSTGAASTLPNIVQPFLGPERKTLPPPQPYNPTGLAMPAVPVTPAVSPAGGRTDARADAPASAPADGGTAPALAAPARPEAAAPAPAARPTKAERAEAERAEREARAREKAAREELEVAQKAAEEAERAEAARLARETKAREKADREAAARAEVEAREEAKRAAKLNSEEAKAARERAKRDAEEAQRLEAEHRRAEAEARRRGQALAEAEARLRDAQAAYQAEIDKAARQ